MNHRLICDHALLGRCFNQKAVSADSPDTMHFCSYSPILSHPPPLSSSPTATTDRQLGKAAWGWRGNDCENGPWTRSITMESCSACTGLSHCALLGSAQPTHGASFCARMSKKQGARRSPGREVRGTSLSVSKVSLMLTMFGWEQTFMMATSDSKI